MMALRTLAAFSLLLSLFGLYSHASPYHGFTIPDYSLSLRDGPVFPDNPPSCPICSQNYANIDSCAQAAPVLANFTMVANGIFVWECALVTMARHLSTSLNVLVRTLFNLPILNVSIGK